VVKTRAKQLVVCIDNEGYAASLEKRKIYIALRDAAAEKHGLLRVVDESGGDYLYPKKSFGRSPDRWPVKPGNPAPPTFGSILARHSNNTLLAPTGGDFHAETPMPPASFRAIVAVRSMLQPVCPIRDAAATPSSS
jgi:hypothetical protein